MADTSFTNHLRIVSQAFRYGPRGASDGQTRTLRLGAAPIQFVVGLWSDESMRGREVEVSVALRDPETREPVFETLWVTTLQHADQESSLLFDEPPAEFRALRAGRTYSYHAAALVAGEPNAVERVTRAEVVE